MIPCGVGYPARERFSLSSHVQARVGDVCYNYYHCYKVGRNSICILTLYTKNCSILTKVGVCGQVYRDLGKAFV